MSSTQGTPPLTAPESKLTSAQRTAQAKQKEAVIKSKIGKSKKNYNDYINPRANAALMTIIIVIAFLLGSGVLFLGALSAALTNGATLTAITTVYAGTEIVHHAWKKYAVEPIRTGDIQGQKEWISYINPFEEIYNAMIWWFQVIVSLWNYSLGVFVYIIQILFDVVMPIFKFIFAQAFPFLMEFLLMRVELYRIGFQALVQLFQALAVGLDGSEFEEDAINTSGGGSAGPVGGDVGAVPGETVGAIPLSFLNSFRKVSRFNIRIFTVVVIATVQILSSLGVSVQPLIDFFMNIVVKYLPSIIKAAIWLINLFDPKAPLGQLLFTVCDLAFTLFQMIFNFCELQQAYLKYMCALSSGIAAIVKKIESAVKIKLPDFPNCNPNNVGNKCIKAPANPFKQFSLLGAGICDEEACASETIAIINRLSQELPSCFNWVATANATLQCMAVVYDYSQRQSNYTGQTSIDTIAKELCFVLSVTVSSQCAQSLPPFSFDYATVANSICVADRSGLVPPAAPFNQQCACIFTAPLCDAGCCNQYARHVNGQIQFYVGGYTCGQLLVQFPETFWCQFDTTTRANITRSTDYTFSASWCQAYRSVIVPACTLASPLATLSAMVTPALVTDYSFATCNQTVEQFGVCKRINTTVPPDFFSFQYSFAQTSLPELYANMQPLGAISFVTIPTASTPIDSIVTLDIYKYYCYAFFQRYNATNPSISSRPASPLAFVFDYCTLSIAEQFGNFDVLNYTYYKLTTPSGMPKPIDLASIPAGVQPFDTVFGGGAPAPSTATPDCLAESTGLNPEEMSTQQECAAQTSRAAVQVSDATSAAGIESAAALEQNSVTIAPAAHLSSLNPPNGSAQAMETGQMDAALTVPTNYEVTPSSETVSTTSNYRTNYPTPPEGTQTPFYVQYKNSPAGRLLFSLKEETNNDEEPLFTASAYGDENETETGEDRLKATAKQELAWNLAGQLLGGLGKEIQKAYQSIKKAGFVNEAAARRGRARVEKLLKIIEEESEERPARFARTRKLLSTGNSGVDAYIEQFWNLVGNSNVQNPGISEEDLMQLLTEQALRDMRIVFSHTANVWVVNIYNTLYNNNVTVQDLDDQGLDYAYEPFGGGTQTRCKNTFEEPLRCCTANTSPFGCCYGLPMCMPMVADYFIAPITTLENIDNWLCPDFDGFFAMWGGTTKTIVTAVVKLSLLLTPADFSGAAKWALGWVTWKNFDIPDYAVQCMFVNMNYIMLGILIIWAVVTFFMLQFFSGIIVIIVAYTNNIRGEWRTQKYNQ